MLGPSWSVVWVCLVTKARRAFTSFGHPGQTVIIYIYIYIYILCALRQACTETTYICTSLPLRLDPFTSQTTILTSKANTSASSQRICHVETNHATAPKPTSYSESRLGQAFGCLKRGPPISGVEACPVETTLPELGFLHFPFNLQMWPWFQGKPVNRSNVLQGKQANPANPVSPGSLVALVPC